MPSCLIILQNQAELWFAESAEISFGHAEESDIGQLAGIPAALNTLPLGDLVFASHAKGTAVLALNRSHKLE